MVVARRGQRTVRVSKSAYEKIYKPKGFVIVSEDAVKTEEKNKEHKEAEHNVEEIESEDVDTIPISDMTSKQLRDYANKHGIDTSSARNLGEARKIVKEAVKNSKM